MNGATEIPSTTVVLPPQTALQIGGQSLAQVTGALVTQPLLLTIVMLNIVFAGIAGYFLVQLEKYRAENLASIINLLEGCILREHVIDLRGSEQELPQSRPRSRSPYVP